LAHDKIRVDDPLISTDVDSMIRTIAERKRVSLSDLRQMCKIDKKTMDKWIAVLEDEGYISVEYGLRGTSIVWRNLEDLPVSEKTRREDKSQIQKESPPLAPEPRQPEAPESPEPGMDEEAVVIKDKVISFLPFGNEKEPEELLSEYLAKKKKSPGEAGDIKSAILHELEGEKRAKVETVDLPAEEAEADSEQIEDSQAPSIEAEESEPEASLEAEKEAEISFEPAESEPVEIEQPEAEPAKEEPAPEPSVYSKETIRPTQKERAVDMRELMGSYLQEINKEKAKIESLKKEKESLYRDKFSVMEGKMQADIVVFTEKIIEKESKISELKERVLELPDKVDQLSKLQEQMEELKTEGREALARTRTRTDEFIASIDQSKGDVEARIDKVRSVLDDQDGRVKMLEKLGVSLDSRSNKLKGALDNAKTQVEELNTAMSALMGDLATVEQMKVEADSLTDSVKQTVSAHGEELASLEEELAGIERMENWVQEYIRDYESKIEYIENYVAKSEDQLSDLRESAEALYLGKFLGELENMTDAYQNDLHDAVLRDRDIESRISESRSRITELVTDSQAMIKKLKSDAPISNDKDFGILVAKVKARTSRTKNIVEEKQQERAKLVDDSRKTRKTAKPAVKSKALKKSILKSVPKKKRK